MPRKRTAVENPRGAHNGAANVDGATMDNRPMDDWAMDNRPMDNWTVDDRPMDHWTMTAGREMRGSVGRRMAAFSVLVVLSQSQARGRER
jgi:uncharacterized protein involved in copper resistance